MGHYRYAKCKSFNIHNNIYMIRFKPNLFSTFEHRAYGNTKEMLLISQIDVRMSQSNNLYVTNSSSLLVCMLPNKTMEVFVTNVNVAKHKLHSFQPNSFPTFP